MKKKLLYIWLIVLCFACNKEYDNRCFEKQGETISEIRNLDYFERVTIWDVFDISLIKDTAYFLVIEAPENIMSYIETSIDDITLNLYDHTYCEWSRKYYRIKIELHFKDLIYIKNQASCRLSTPDTLKLKYLQIYARSELAEMDLLFDAFRVVFVGSYTTSGTYFFGGKCSYFNVECHCATTVDARNLTCDSARFKHNSIGDIKVDVKEKLDIAFQNRGNVIVKKMPEKVIIKEQSGEGRVKEAAF